MALTIEQKRALAVAAARARLQDQTIAEAAPAPTPSPEKPTNPIDELILQKFGPQLSRMPDLLKGTSGRLGASRIRSYLHGGADIPIGAAQLAANVTGIGKEGINQAVQQAEAETEAMRQQAGREGFDVARLAGGITGPAPVLAAKAIKPAVTVASKLKQGAVAGAAAGAFTPVTKPEEYWNTKGGQALMGASLGVAIPASGAAVGFLGKVGRGVLDLTTKKGAERILTRYQKALTGKERIPETVAALKTKEAIPGYAATAKEKLVQTPGGSPLVRHQEITAEQPGGLSAAFADHLKRQDAQIDKAYEALDKSTAWMRNWALNRANRGGVNGHNVAQRIDDMLEVPGQRASDVVQKTLNETREKILTLSKESGRIDANDLYTVRKEIGNVIQKNSKETATWDKRLTSKLQDSIQDVIDEEITKAGGAGWRKYLATYAQQRQAIDRTLERRGMSPIQPTNIGGGRDVAEETRLHLPQMLSRPMMVTNHILKKIGAGVEQRIDPIAQERYLNPEKLAQALETVPVVDRLPVIRELMRRGHIPLVAGLTSEGAP